MLAELEGETASADTAPKSNGAAKNGTTTDENPKEPDEVVKEDSSTKPDDQNDPEDEAREQRQDRRSDRNHDRGRRDHNGRGHGRGGRGNKYGGDRRDDHKFRNFRDNIKSDLTTQDVTDDPDAIRKQVKDDQSFSLCFRSS